jgi:undecaprenyl-diphosphatase
MAIIYWAVSKEYGTFFLMGWSGNRLVNGFLKVTFCAYRPWVRDPRIIPFGNSMTTATGYSFPSGHTMNAATVYGGSAVQNGLPKILRIFLAILVALVAFSRIFLGVHTPQDILVGAGAGMIVMWLTLLLMKWLKEHPEKDWIVLCIGVALAILLALYAGLKSYPVDYDSEGNVLVEGKKMMNDTFKGVGYCLAFLIGWILERRFVKFSTDIPGMQRVIRVVVGLMGYYVVSLILCTLIKEWIPGSAGTMISCFLQVFYVTFLFPLSIRFLERMRIGT